MNSSEIDKAILSALSKNPYRMKVAMVLAQVSKAMNRPMDDDSVQVIADRIVALVSRGQLEGFGNLENWRHSEVKLRAENEG